MNFLISIFKELNNRELSVLIWLLLLIGFFLFTSIKEHISLNGVLSAFFQKPILFLLLLFAIYIGIEVSIFSQVFNLTNGRIKDITLWILYTGFWQIFQFNKVKSAQAYLKVSLASILVWTIFFEFFSNLYVFGFLYELILVPITSFLVVLELVAKKDKESYVSTFIQRVLSVLGFAILTYSTYCFLNDTSRLKYGALFVDFIIPICFSIAFLPFVILIWFYSKIEDNYVSVNSLTSKELNPFSILKILFILRFNLKLIELWKDSAWRKGLKNKRELIKEAKNVLSITRKQITYYYSPLTLGFGLQEAKKYLSEFGISVGDYKKLEVDNEAWFACSPCKEFGEGIVKNNIAYYVEGTSDIVKSLKIVANCNSKFNPNEYEFQQFTTPFFKSLFQRAFKTEMPQALIQKVTFFIPFEERFLGKVVQFEKQLWLGNNGYHVSFTIRNEDYLN